MKRLLGGMSIALVLLAFPLATSASVGVGVGTGRIVVQEKLKNGGIYSLPSITVFNTGTQTSDYSMAVTLNESQPQLKPNPKWFSFSPDSFSLPPGKSQIVTPTVHLPISTPPGDYFAYLEAHPAGTVQQGTTAVGVAAATKLSFTVEPSNVLFGILFRLLNLFKEFAPYTYIASSLIVLILLWRIVVRRWLHLEIKVKKSGSVKKDQTEEKED